MIRFFRTMRHRLFEEGRPARYLGYAAGEIVLVVIGILIALQINNWNENRKALDTSRVLLAEFSKDLATDVQGVNRVVALLEQQTDIEADVLRAVSYAETDVDKLQRVFFSTVYQEFIQDRTFDKLQNSPDPSLVGFPELQSALTMYYTDNRFLMDYYNQQEASYLDEYDALDVLREDLELPLSGFPILVPESQQNAVLIAYAESVQGRNFVKQNYLRRTRMIEIFDDVGAEAQRLIDRIENRLATGS